MPTAWFSEYLDLSVKSFDFKYTVSGKNDFCMYSIKPVDLVC